MSDKYKNIRDRHEIELLKKLTELSDKEKRRKKVFLIIGIIYIITLLVWAFSQSW